MREAGAFRCQATELVAASEAFPPDGRGRKYLHEVQVGNVGIVRFLRVGAGAVVRKPGRTLGLLKEVPLSSRARPSRPRRSSSGRASWFGSSRSARSHASSTRTAGAEVFRSTGRWFRTADTP